MKATTAAPEISQLIRMPSEYTSAMIKMATMSSITAKASRNIRSDSGTREPIIVKSPTAKAISVATGTPQPLAATPPAIDK